ncbi:MAG TPA: PstS family phosphate ABC transporter substrate-binding protein [Leptolyngbyaceae cyanobacterium M33_DOE_097]|uniref:Phosphate-binding protein n=1 Tax=Oscillatoriales cyanobacterium SpSt-418 TaxID=2282169 RepID=A0A7C3KKR9_9CYAN|nr:PstS family phosphate ABC transporter substrate-binding protein [Leptolyngbyaceae cyanobacterium M33_DOE_097]
MAVKSLFNRVALTSAIALGATLSVGSVVQSQEKIVKIDGSSTVYPITEVIAEGFQKAGNAKVTVGVSGTGGGFKKFCAGETDISNASRKIKDKEIEACKASGTEYVEIPVAIDALTVVVNPNSAISNITTEELKKMWAPEAEGKITRWNQVNASFPNAPLKLFGPGPDSGTFDYFTEEIVGKARASRKDYVPSEDDNVLVQGVSRDKNALGYFGYAYYVANKGRLKALNINGVAPTPENVDATKYPMARTIYIYVSKKAATKPEVKSFVQYYLTNAKAAVQKVNYVPLKDAQYADALKMFESAVASK